MVGGEHHSASSADGQKKKEEVESLFLAQALRANAIVVSLSLSPMPSQWLWQETESEGLAPLTLGVVDFTLESTAHTPKSEIKLHPQNAQSRTNPDKYSVRNSTEHSVVLSVQCEE